MDEMALAQDLRRSCSVCGSRDLAWARADVAAETARLGSQRAAIARYLASGGVGTDSAWWCPTCDNCGALGAAMTYE